MILGDKWGKMIGNFDLLDNRLEEGFSVIWNKWSWWRFLENVFTTSSMQLKHT